MNVWLTQTLWTSEPLQLQLSSMGISSQCRNILISEANEVNLPQVNSDAVVVMSSRNAIWYWQQQLPLPKNLLVMGPASAAFAESLGADSPKYPPHEGSESLIDYLVSMQVSEVIIATAERRRGVLEQGLRDLGIKVDLLSLYKNRPDHVNIDFIKNNFQTGDIVVVASMQAAEVLLEHISNAIWITVSDRLSKWLLEQGESRVVNSLGTHRLADTIYSCYLNRK